LPSSVTLLEITGLPRFVEPGLERAIEPQEYISALRWLRLQLAD
jgi:hypothetical protein